MLELKIWNPDDENIIPKILESASIAHSQPINTIEWFKWKFKNSPFGPAIIAYAQSEEGIVAGAVAFGMYELSIKGKIAKAALSYETFVHPSFQGKGLFTKLTALAIEEAKNRGVDVLFNFPNSKSLPGFKKMGWTHTNCIKLYVRPASFFKFLFKFNPKALRLPFLADKVTSVNQDSIEKLSNELLSGIMMHAGDKVIAHRTASYLKWRFQSFPLNNYKIICVEEGIAIVRTGKRGNYSEAQIMEVFPKEQLSKKFYTSIMKQINFQVKPDLITTNVSGAHPAQKILPMLLFASLPNKINFTTLPLKTEYRHILDGNNWIITGTEFHTY